MEEDNQGTTTQNSIDTNIDKKLENVRKGQKIIISAILANFLVFFLTLIDPLLGILNLAVLALSIYGIILLCKGLSIAIWVRVIIFIGLVIPLIGLLILLRLNAMATKALRASGYKVGLMGASPRVV
ncbi:MAG: hypothetical protein CMP91_01815 [Gammaproteobacteria bacterium]|nr:hypothetical protein [Gammaproteobacteria bacterium]|tara:strand:+ start:37866 stop:38246 length:381 start_codon:yes stop_codon:yes gene_type:complete